MSLSFASLSGFIPMQGVYFSPSDTIELKPPISNDLSRSKLRENLTQAFELQPDDVSESPKHHVSCTENTSKLPKRGKGYTTLQALFSIDMLILFITTICGISGTLTAIDNLGQIGSSLGCLSSINKHVYLTS
ncbi:hypothetical protein ACFE04_014882 [Oxalis oulophora]